MSRLAVPAPEVDSVVWPSCWPVPSITVTVQIIPFEPRTASEGCDRVTFMCVVPEETSVWTVRVSEPATATRGASHVQKSERETVYGVEVRTRLSAAVCAFAIRFETFVPRTRSTDAARST